MSTAVSLWFDDALEDAVRSLWQEIANAGISDDLHVGPYRPHLTLGVWATARIDALVLALRAEGPDLAQVPLCFDEVRFFDDGPTVVYLAPRRTAALDALQARIHTLARAHVAGPLPFTSPPEWTPHCTVAWKLNDAARTIACRGIVEARLPLVGVGTALGVIDTPAEIELERIPLGSGPA